MSPVAGDFRVKDARILFDIYFYSELKAKLPIKTELQKQNYGDWEFEITDPNGYVLVFSEFTA